MEERIDKDEILDKKDEMLDKNEEKLDEGDFYQEDIKDEDLTGPQNEEEIDNKQNESDLKLEELKQKLEDMTNTAKRAQADFMNYKKRTEKENALVASYALEGLMTDLLIVLDNFDRALNSIEDKNDDFYKGVDLIKKQLLDVLKKFGLEEIEAEGQDFDPNVHHAVLQEEKEDVDAGKVIEVMQKGFKLKDKVIRASMVKVSK